ncbi:hypothetical protein Tco_0169760 [Tanacetum coccineum]
MHSKEHVQDDDEKTDDESVHGDQQVNDDDEEEMTNAKDAKTGNGDEEITVAAKADAEKAEEVKDDVKKAELPRTSSSLYVSLDAEINSLLDVQIQQEIPYIQSPSVLTVSVFVIYEPSVLVPIPETPLVAPAITLLPPSSISTISHKDVQELKEAGNTTTLRALLKSEIPSAVNAYIGSSMGDALHKVLQKHMEELIQKYNQQVDYKEMIEESVQENIINKVNNQLLKFLPKAVSDFATPVIQSTVNKALEKTPLPVAQSSSQAQSSLKAVESLAKYELKTILFDKMDKGRSYLTHDKHQALFYALLNSMSLDDAIAREEPVEKPVFEMASYDIEQTVDDMANDVDQPPDNSTQAKDKSLKKDWFTQPPRPLTPDQD